MQDAPFRIEVSSQSCEPSVGVFLRFGDFKYVADSPIVVTTIGFGMAGGLEDRDVLFFRSEDPRLTTDYADSYDNVQKEYASLCAEFGKCPNKIRAYRNYWNFADNAAGNITRTFADFKRITVDKPIAGFKGDLPVVVYTQIKNAAFDPYGNNAYLNILKTHPIVLRFK
jgi:hypothetical protein